MILDWPEEVDSSKRVGENRKDVFDTLFLIYSSHLITNKWPVIHEQQQSKATQEIEAVVISDLGTVMRICNKRLSSLMNASLVFLATGGWMLTDLGKEISKQVFYQKAKNGS